MSRIIPAGITRLEILRKLRRHVEETISALKPINASSLDPRDFAQLRWQIHLAVLMASIAKSLRTLAKAEDDRACIILYRSIYEYRVRSAWCLKNPDKALAIFESLPKRHHRDMQRLPALDSATELAITSDYLEWRKTANLAGENLGVPGLTAMTIELADPTQRLADSTGREYTHEETIAHAIPSWYAHGSPQLIIEVFSNWQDIEDWELIWPISAYSYHNVVRSAIGDICAYLTTLRRYYELSTAGIQTLYLEAYGNGKQTANSYAARRGRGKR